MIKLFLIYSFLVFVLGLCLGSFLNVVVYRLPRDKSIIGVRSHCPSCDSLIKWYDNIPLLSFLLLRGHCRNCGKRIDASYFTGELMSGVVAVGCFIWWSRGGQIDWRNFLLSTIFLLVALTVTRIDLLFSIIPNEISYSFILSGVILGFIPHYPFTLNTGFILDLNQGFNAMMGTFFGGGLFFLLAVLSPLIYGKPALGMGDVKLMAGFGAWIGLRLVLLTMVLGSIIGAIVGSIAMLMQGKSLRTEIPFGPFLCAGAVTSFIWGDSIIFWYLNLI